MSVKIDRVNAKVVVGNGEKNFRHTYVSGGKMGKMLERLRNLRMMYWLFLRPDGRPRKSGARKLGLEYLPCCARVGECREVWKVTGEGFLEIREKDTEEDDGYMTCEESIPNLTRMGLNGPDPSETVEQSKKDFCKIDFRHKRVGQISNKGSVGGDQDTNE